MAKANRRFTIYDVMDAKGVFDGNIANLTSPGYVKQEYPKMLYHPQGATRISVSAEIITTPLGPKSVGEQRELIHRIVNSAEEEVSALKDGWHLTPGEAMTAAGMSAPEQSASQALELAQAQLARQQEEISRLQAQVLAGQQPLAPVKAAVVKAN